MLSVTGRPSGLSGVASGHTRDVTSALLSEALAPESPRRLLIAVARAYGLVGCVSGRRASEARAMVSIGTISYLGSHGAEILRAGWTEPVVDKELEDWAERI